MSRPEISYRACKNSPEVKNPILSDIHSVEKVIQIVNSTCQKYPKLHKNPFA